MSCLVHTRLIVGLGNPGAQYQGTRHNAGFLLVDRLVARLGASEVPSRGPSIIWRAEAEETVVFLMKPLTYMNLSGDAVMPFLNHQPLPLTGILVAYDDVDLPLGTVRARARGSAGGQKGMRHIIDCLNSREIPRLRIGIDSPERGGLPLPDFVLREFTDAELPVIREALENAEDATMLWLTSDMDRMMAAVNRRAAPKPTPTHDSDPDDQGGEP